MIQLRKVLGVVAVLSGLVGVASAEGWREDRGFREPVRAIRYERADYRIRPVVRVDACPVEVIRPTVEFIEPGRWHREHFKHEVYIRDGFHRSW